MPRWHWVYRDFVAVARGVSKEDWIHSCAQYLSRNWDLLNKIHFQPKGFESYRQVLDRLRSLGLVRYSRVFDNLHNPYEFVSHIVSMTDHILNRLGYKAEDQDVYVIVDLDCTNIYSTHYEGRLVTVLCLEATDGILEEVELLLAHEAHHWKRQSVVSHNIFGHSVQERCVSEGLAACFAEEVQPGRVIHEYCFVPPETVAWVQTHLDELEEIVQRTARDNIAAMAALFSSHPETVPFPGMPLRTGYVYGYLVVKSFLNRMGKTATDMVDVNCGRIFSEFYGRLST